MKRRMICDDILDSGKFLRLPPSTQALYSHCVLGTDDDGIVDVFTIMRKVGAKEDDVVLLVEREFITPLDPKEYIFWITGFQDFNKIQPHIKEDSKYLPLLLSTVQGVEVVKSTKSDDNKRRYAQLKERRKLQQQIKNDDPSRITGGSFQDQGHDPTTRIGKDRIGKENKETISKDIVPFSNGYLAWKDEWKEKMGFDITKALKENENALKACIATSSAQMMHDVLSYLHWLKTTKKAKERPHWFQYTTSFIKVRQFWDHIMAGMSDDAFQLAAPSYADDLFNR